MSVRFIAWTPDNRVRVIRLDGDRRVDLCAGGPTEEGSFFAGDSYWIEDGSVMRESYRRERDCDGLIEEYHMDRCDVADLRNGTGRRWPEWRSDRQWQRDHAAEAMGY